MEQLHFFTNDWVSGKIPRWKSFLDHLKGRSDVHFLEIGCFEGRATCWFLQNILTHPSCSMTCIDPLPAFTNEQLQERGKSMGFQPPFPQSWSVKETFLHNIYAINSFDKLILHQGKSIDMLSLLPKEYYDCIYIDGSHYAPDVLIDAVGSWRTLKPGGIMIFDDYELTAWSHPHENPKFGIDAFLSTFQNHYEIIDKGWQVVLRKES